jgi:lysozyme
VKVCAAGQTVEGIDVSKYEGTIDWKAVQSAGVAFAFIRVSDGLNSHDGYFASNWANAKAAGVYRGV